MPLPPNISERRFNRAMRDFADVVGDQWAFTDDELLGAYSDPFSPLLGHGQPMPSGVVAPQSVEEVQGLLEVANQYRIPLWAISTGKNFGYGGTDAIVPGSMIIDLKRMNRILEVNEELAYAVVEPGVSQYDLWRYIQANDLALWVDGPSPAWAGVISNTTERGAGYSPKGNRIDQMCGLEVVLPNGDVLRTGMAALEDSPTAYTYKYGLGPDIQGMFSQSNFGVITKMGVLLSRRPEVYRSITVDVPKYRDIIPFMDVTSQMRIDGTMRTAASILPKPPEGMGPPGGGFGGPPPGGEPPNLDMIYTMIENTMGWRARIGISGHRAQVEADWRKIYSTYKDALPDCEIGSDYYEAPYNYDEWDTLAKLHAAVPSMQETEFWQHGAVFISTLLPCTGAAYWRQIEVMREVYRPFGMPYAGSIAHLHVERCMMTLLGAPIDTSSEEAAKRGTAFGKAIIAAAAEQGWAEYRTPITFMQAASDVFAFNNNALNRFYETIKDAIDPNGIFAPGKNGVWGAAHRDGDLPQTMRDV